MKYYTTIEQSKKLVELGLNPMTADMLYTSLDNFKEPWVWNSKPGMHPSDVPCWSTEALLKLLPREINRTDNYILNNILVYPNKGYCISYRNLSNYENKEQIMYISDTLLECAFEMIVKLKELKLI